MNLEAIPYTLTKTEIDEAVKAWTEGSSAPFYRLLERVIEETKKHCESVVK